MLTVICRNEHTFPTNARLGSTVRCPECRKSTGDSVGVYVMPENIATAAAEVDEADAHSPRDEHALAALYAEVGRLRAELAAFRRVVDEHEHAPQGDSDDYRRAILGRWLHQLQHAFAASGVVLAGGGVAVRDASEMLGITEANAGQRLREAAKLGLIEQAKSGRRNVYTFKQGQDHLYHAAETVEQWPADVQ